MLVKAVIAQRFKLELKLVRGREIEVFTFSLQQALQKVESSFFMRRISVLYQQMFRAACLDLAMAQKNCEASCSSLRSCSYLTNGKMCFLTLRVQNVPMLALYRNNRMLLGVAAQM